MPQIAIRIRTVVLTRQGTQSKKFNPILYDKLPRLETDHTSLHYSYTQAEDLQRSNLGCR